MNYKKYNNRIEIYNKSDFNPQHILECGQVFSYEKVDEKYNVFPEDKFAQIVEDGEKYIIYTFDVDYFENYFNLKVDYNIIKNSLLKYQIMTKPIQFGYGIRILKQNLFETLISFIISANNNIKRIKLILSRLRKYFSAQNGKEMFPTYLQLKSCNEDFFKEIGCGYRAEYLVKVLNQITPEILEDWRKLDTQTLQKNLIALSGVGPKVADCIMLFGYGKKDVFPVDTWIYQMYCKYYKKIENRLEIRKDLINQFGQLSGYAQQYLFYFQRSFDN